jgi:hypothetical protein
MTKDDAVKTDAYQEGQKGYLSGDENPYKHWSEDWHLYQEGWYDARSSLNNALYN